MGWNTDEPGDQGYDARAKAMAAACDHHSVTEELLRGTGRFSATFYLYDDPAVAYLDEGERPHFAFYDARKGIGVGEERETVVPDNNGITIALVTDRRVLGLVGRAAGDYSCSLDYDVVTDVEFTTDGRHDGLVVETVEESYRFPVARTFEAEDLRRAVAFVREQMVDPDGILDGTDDGPAPDEATPADHAPDAGEASMVSDGGAPDADGAFPGTGTPDLPGDGAPTDADLPGDGAPAHPDPPGEGAGSTDADDPLARIEKLHDLKEAGAISEAEYERKKAELLDRV